MCGISFYCNRKVKLTKQLKESLIVTSHRGPDATGIVEYTIGLFNIGLGHNRLSIMDLTESGSQPMKSNMGNIISYNGEIYNHIFLRNKLKNLGYKFVGNSDTEVILKLFDEFGSDSFAMLNGMFAFVILDTKNEKLFIVRDAVGIKPIYLYQANGEIYGSSEIRGLKAFNVVDTEIDQNDIYEFFNNGFLYEPSTGFKHIKKLMPGHFCEFNLSNSNIKFQRYKKISEFYESRELSEKLEQVIKAQQIADVPLGVFFSGGADSSILASYFDNTELFFAKYDSDPSADIDLKYSKLIAEYLCKELNVAELYSNNQSVDSILESVEFVAKNTEELISDYTFWATYQLSKAAKRSGYKVMLSGMGGDEAFAGYPRYLVLKNHRLIRLLSPFLRIMLKLRIFPRVLNKKFERLVSYSIEKEWGVAYSRMLGYFSRKELEALFGRSEKLKKNYSSKVYNILEKYEGDKNDKVKLAQYLDALGFLSHNLMVSDKASMLASIELRVPLLDESIVAHGIKVPTNELIYNKQTKYPLKNILKKTLPDRLIERPKTGFNPPLDSLIDKIGAKRLKNELSNLNAILNRTTIELLIDNHFSRGVNNTYKLWQLLYFSQWIKVNNN